jgi:peptide/nickel transport system ATP-binding protein/Fe3+-transporting ATPase
MLEAKNISFRYNSDLPWLFQHIDLEIQAGEMVGLSGDSGKGKTTLAKVLAGYLPPSSGEVLVDGGKLPEKGYFPVQLLFQHPEQAVNPRWKARKILAEGSPPPGELLAMLSIDSAWLDRFPHELSGGELQRLAVARALGPNTRYLIADEMTSMLDANTQAQIWHVVSCYARDHDLGVLIISHDKTLLHRLCHRIEPIFESISLSNEKS